MTFEEWWNTYLFLGDDLDKELAKEAWEAGAESVVNSKLIPEGYVLVPVEPTEKMILNGMESLKWPTSVEEMLRIYSTMIQAAQEEE